MKTSYQEETGTNPDEASDIGIRMQVLAGEIYRLESSIEWLGNQAFPETAVDQQLEYHASQRGIKRKAAAKAHGILKFSRLVELSYDVTIPKGTVCSTSGDEPVEYETTEDVTLAAGSLFVEAQAQAVEGGESGNASAGYIDTLITLPTSVEFVTNEVAFTGGRDEESDDNLRIRLLDAYSVLPNGTNAETYEKAALKVEGVGSAMAVARENGIGTVGVYIWGEDGAPSNELIEKVQEELDKLKEINVDVNVKAAATNEITVYAYILPETGSTISTAVAQAKEKVQELFDSKKIGDSIYKVEILWAMMKAEAVKNCTLGASTLDYSSAPGKIPVLGVFAASRLS